MTREEAIYWLGRSNGLLLRLKSKCRQPEGLELIPVSDQDREDIDTVVESTLGLLNGQREVDDVHRDTHG